MAFRSRCSSMPIIAADTPPTIVHSVETTKATKTANTFLRAFMASDNHKRTYPNSRT